MLSRQLNYSIRKRDEQAFVRARLDLLDWHYCLQMEVQLWQSYCSTGVAERQWPVRDSCQAMLPC